MVPSSCNQERFFIGNSEFFQHLVVAESCGISGTIQRGGVWSGEHRHCVYVGSLREVAFFREIKEETEDWSDRVIIMYVDDDFVKKRKRKQASPS